MKFIFEPFFLPQHYLLIVHHVKALLWQKTINSSWDAGNVEEKVGHMGRWGKWQGRTERKWNCSEDNSMNKAHFGCNYMHIPQCDFDHK